MAIAVQVASDGSQAELQIQFTDWQGFRSRPGIDGVVSAKVACHPNSASACFDEVLTVANGFVGGQQGPPNLPFLVP